MRQRGFTLVELVVTMVLIGILAATVMPRLDMLRGFDEIAFSNQLRSTLEFARKSAVAQRRHVCVEASGNGIALTRHLADPDTLTGTITCNAPNQIPGSSSNILTAPNGVTLTTPTSTLVFDPLGRVYQGPATDCDAASRSVQYCYSIQGSSSPTPQTIMVEQETGYVH